MNVFFSPFSFCFFFLFLRLGNMIGKHRHCVLYLLCLPSFNPPPPPPPRTTKTEFGCHNFALVEIPRLVSFSLFFLLILPFVVISRLAHLFFHLIVQLFTLYLSFSFSFIFILKGCLFLPPSPPLSLSLSLLSLLSLSCPLLLSHFLSFFPSFFFFFLFSFLLFSLCTTSADKTKQ